MKLEVLGLKVNFYSMVVVNDNGISKMLYSAHTNDRMLRHRPETTKKYSEMLTFEEIDDFPIKRNFADEFG